MRVLTLVALIIFVTLVLCAWVSFGGGWTLVCGVVASDAGWTPETCAWPLPDERVAAFGVLTQAFGTLAAAAIAALAAVEASRLTISQYEKQDSGRRMERQRAVAQMLAVELATIPRPLSQLLRTGTAFTKVKADDDDGRGGAKVDEYAYLTLPRERLRALLPDTGVYNGLVGELGLLHPETTQALALFFAQVRRLEIVSEPETETITVFPPSVGYLVLHLMDALKLLSAELHQLRAPRLLSLDAVSTLEALSGLALALHDDLVAQKNKMALGMQFREEINFYQTHWSDIKVNLSGQLNATATAADQGNLAGQ